MIKGFLKKVVREVLTEMAGNKTAMSEANNIPIIPFSDYHPISNSVIQDWRSYWPKLTFNGGFIGKIVGMMEKFGIKKFNLSFPVYLKDSEEIKQVLAEARLAGVNISFSPNTDCMLGYGIKECTEGETFAGIYAHGNSAGAGIYSAITLPPQPTASQWALWRL